MTLLEQLRFGSPEDVLVVTESESITRAQLLERADLVAAKLTDEKRGRILICSTQVIDSLVVMAALDGFSSAIGFASPGISTDSLGQIAKSGRFTWVLTDIDLQPARSDSESRWANIADFMLGEATNCAAKPVANGTSWIMTTSGTTGEPKLVEHTLESLTRTTKLTPRAQPIRWAMLYDFTRFAGMQVLLQSVLSGATLVAPPINQPLESRLKFFIFHSATHFSATPTLWRQILMSPLARELQPEVLTLGGEIADQATLKRLALAYPLAKIVHIYASTEAGVGFSVSDGRGGFPVSFLSDLQRSVELRVTEGMLYVRNVPVCARNAHLGEDFADAVGWISTGDLVDVLDDRVMFMGRASGVINVGGNKVNPEVVEAVLNDLDIVSISKVYSKKNSITGALVMADVVLSGPCTDEQTTVRAIKKAAAAKLRNFEVPAFVRITNSIETNLAGKLKRS